MPMFGPIEIFSKFCLSKFSRFWKPNEIGMFPRVWEMATSLKSFL